MVLNSRGVFQCADALPATDGMVSGDESDLERVFENCENLGSDSGQLETWVHNRFSEYHLGRRRAQLLRGFQFDPVASVLELGAGCGGITRFLGETFDYVVSVEANAGQAALARSRCADLDNVTLLSAEPASLRFRRGFDIVFCVSDAGYGGTTAGEQALTGAVFEQWTNLLADGGVLVVVFENPSGEWSGGIVADELVGRFQAVDYFYPLPDRELPDAVLAHALFDQVNAGALLSSFQKRSGAPSDGPRPEVDRNGGELGPESEPSAALAPMSILAVASSSAPPRWVATADLGVLYNRHRAEAFHTRTRIYLDPDVGVTVEKVPLYSGIDTDTGLQLKAYREAWIEGETLHQQVLARARDESASLAQIFEPARVWYQSLLGATQHDVLEGNMIDAIWQNSLLVNGATVHIDLEWHWQHPVRPEQVLMRAVYWFLSDLRTCTGLARSLRWRSTRRIICEVGALLGVRLGAEDIRAFHAFEARFNSAAYGRTEARSRRRIGLILRLPQQLIKLLLWVDGLVRRDP